MYSLLETVSIEWHVGKQRTYAMQSNTGQHNNKRAAEIDSLSHWSAIEQQAVNAIDFKQPRDVRKIKISCHNGLSPCDICSAPL